MRNYACKEDVMGEENKNDTIAFICLILFLGVCGAILGGIIGVAIVGRVARHMMDDPFNKEALLKIVRVCALLGCTIGVGFGLKGWFESSHTKGCN